MRSEKMKGRDLKGFTTPVPARVDIRSLAALTLFFKAKGELRLTKSGLIRRSLDTLVDILYENGLVEKVDNPERALELLSDYGLGDFVATRRGTRALVTKMAVNEERLMRVQHNPTVTAESMEDATMKALEGLGLSEGGTTSESIEEKRERLGDEEVVNYDLSQGEE